MEEVWKPITGYEGLYEVSSLGRIKSLNYNHTGKEKILKICKDGRGYLCANLCKDGKAKNHAIHRLVAKAFLPNPDNLPQVNHKDENKENNKVENLEWCSRSYNCSYGTRNKRTSEKNSKPVFSISKVNGLIMEYTSATEAERVTGIAQQSICRCCKGKLKSAGGYIWKYL